MLRKLTLISFKLMASLTAIHVNAQDTETGSGTANDTSHQDIARQLQNPVADLISVPFQSNFEFDAGPNDGFKYTLNFQPVIPFGLGKNWNLITRTIIPVVSQIQVVPSTEVTSSQAGLSDILFSAFLSPEGSELIWGIGPALLFPSATHSLVGTKKWAAGPTAVLLKQSGSLTLGILMNHLWSYAGDDTRQDINATYYQPFISYINEAHTTFSLSSESTRDWKSNSWTTSIIPAISQLTKLVKIPTNLQLGMKYYFSDPGLTPKWGIRFAIILVIPS